MRYFFGTDNSGHTYLVDASKRIEWDAWADLPEDDERGWETPEYAHRLNCPRSLVTFEKPSGKWE